MGRQQEYKVQLRGGFADREGFGKINKTIQYDDLDERSRNALFNLFSDLYEACFQDYEKAEARENFHIHFLRDVFASPVNANARISSDKFLDMIQELFNNNPYYDVFTVIEYTSTALDNNEQVAVEVRNLFNRVFEKEYIGYRFVGPYITKITDKNEISSVDESLNNPYKPVRVHIDKGLALLSDRDNPDYENSIKESITAVESICNIITGNDKSTLGDALKTLEKSHYIHPAMKAGFSSLYGYTSDASGIRHSGKQNGDPATFEDAKYMLVTCSAFINYLVGVTAKSSN